MRLTIPALLLVVLAAAPALANEVYRTVDERGQVIYSDRPLSPSSVRVSVDSRPTDPARAEAELERLRSADEARRQPPQDEISSAIAEQRALRAAACQEARQALEAYERAPRLFEELPDGGRRFLSDEEVVQARQAARQAVIDFCDE